ncbi:SRPBCC family protein [Aquincola tertiaricarbonis]|uniref:SRPBCC family protein n=1 Tax=Aquincola tertiaricarbonis TaxID=391953 RepID=A0ABY4S6R7_AQUTE|nr:SRPBCC family protein [Aquincola tertiaricarbonis]URI06914.1 SRPBCC family protein [Aquincola tertiaricarbonis]
MRVSVSATVAKPAETLFWLSQDYQRRLEWDKYLAEAHLLGSATVGAVGVESFCRNRGGSVLVSKYISFSPPSHAAVQMTSGPWVLRKFGGTWRFESIGERSTRVRFVYNFKARPAVLRWLVEPVIGGLYRRDMQRRLAAFKDWAEQQAD